MNIVSGYGGLIFQDFLNYDSKLITKKTSTIKQITTFYR